jgi:hypothetical protein
VLSQLNPSSNEIIANEVYNIGHTAENLSRQYYEKGLLAVLERRNSLYPELEYFAEKTLLQLLDAIEDGQSKSLLRVLNDFSYHSQQQLQYIKKQLIPFEMNNMAKANQWYLDEMHLSLAEVPERIRIKRMRQEFQLKKEDSLRARVYKLRKISQARLTGKPVGHSLNLLPAVRFYLVHKRIVLLQELMHNYTTHSFSQLVAIRKVLTNLHESVEKVKLGGTDKGKMLDQVRLEKSRIRASISVLQDENRHFVYQSGQRLYDSLLEDLQGLVHHLESTNANLLSKNFSAYFKREENILEELHQYPDVLGENLRLFINKGGLDFSVLFLKSRINSKIQKYFSEYSALMESSLLKVIRQYKLFARDGLSDETRAVVADGKLSHGSLNLPNGALWFRPLFEEVRELLKDLPDKMEIGGDQFAEVKEADQLKPAEAVLVNYRKTVSFFVGSELIDFSSQCIDETQQQMQQIISTVKDQVKLINFSLGIDNDKVEEPEPIEEKEHQRALLESFSQKMDDESRRITVAVKTLGNRFEQGLKSAFDPLSSATISRTSMVVNKQMREGSGLRLYHRLQTSWNQAAGKVQEQFVNLLYSKSEGMLWFNHLEKTSQPEASSNKDTLGFVEAITPRAAAVNALPFYYRSLFSGQSGTGEDFWVGMKDQVKTCDNAIERFKAGFPGALVITGLRSSGKSSLSKKMAKKYFTAENIHSIRAPKGCAADVDLFKQLLLEALNARNKSIHDVFNALPQGKVIIIQDLGLWWERRPGGIAVIQLITELIGRYGSKCLFIINVNSFALQLIDRWCGLSSYALATVGCEPFDARELKEMILLRHQAGGMKLVYNKKHEEKMTALDYARLFNKLFELSYGNPGTAISLWKAAIQKVSGKTMYMQPFHLPSIRVFDQLSQEQRFLIRQFMIHRRFSAAKLAESLERQESQVLADINELIRAGILVERFEGIFAIRSGLDLFLADKQQSFKP